MNIRNSVCALVFLLSFLFCIDVYATITGTVTDKTESPVEDALVTFIDESNNGNTFSTHTDSEGRYELSIFSVSVEDKVPTRFELQQNYPNPFNPTTTIPYSLESSGQVSLTIYNVMGQKVRALVDDFRTAGIHTVIWNGWDDNGKDVASGIYIYSLSCGNLYESKKMLLLDGKENAMISTAPLYTPHTTAKNTNSMTCRITITGEDIVSYEESSLSTVDGGIYDFNVQRLKVLTFLSIPSGSFRMGDVEGVGRNIEIPVHTVMLSLFEMNIYEVTNAQYAAYLTESLASGDITVTSSSVKGAGGDYNGQEYLDLDSGCDISYSGGTFMVEFGKENHPVFQVTWYGAKSFALYYDLDLPTEAEWEYSARVGKQYKYSTYDGIISSYHANYNNYVGHTTDVGSYSANPYGLYDMSGNVCEWCHDLFGPYTGYDATNPTGALTGSFRVRRGGGWLHDDYECRTASRSSTTPFYGTTYIGFRVVRRPGGVTY